MFDVIHKPTGKVFTVYVVHGGLLLIYGAVENDDDVCWRSIYMSDCEPIGGERGCTIKTL